MLTPHLQSQKNNKAFNIDHLEVGRIDKITQDSFLFANVTLKRGHKLFNVPFYSGGKDLVTSNLHGLFVQPREKQLVVVGFIKNLFNNPVVICGLPIFDDRLNITDYQNLLTDIEDIYLAHFSGTKITLKKNGSVEIIDKNNNKIEMTNIGMKLTDKNNNIIEMKNTGINITDKNNNVIDMTSSNISINSHLTVDI